MATVAQVVRASLSRILVQPSEAEVEASEAQDFIFSMNNYMLALDAEGIRLGYTEVSDLGDTITIPTGALRGLIANMAIEVAPDYDGTVSEGLRKAAREGMIAMEQLGQTVGATPYPPTLPIGSGNEGDFNLVNGYHYYPDLEQQILAETTGSISLEVNTENVIDGG